MIPFFAPRELSASLDLPAAEMHLAAFSVSAICGVVSAVVVTRLKLSSWVSAATGFFVTWLVCHFGFPVAHHWYGANTVWHRNYDAVAIFSAWIMHLELNRDRSR